MAEPGRKIGKATPAPNPPSREIYSTDPEAYPVKTVPYTIIPEKKAIRYRYVWNVDGFRCALENRTRCLTSPIFSTDFNKHLRWSLVLYPSGVSDERSPTSSLYLCLETSDKTEVTVKFSFGCVEHSIMKSDVFETTEPCTFQYGIKTATFGIENFLIKDTNPYRRYDKDPSFQIYCIIESYESIFEPCESSKEGPCKPPEGSFLNDMQLLFENPKSTDFTITVDGQEFPVHKTILMTRSSVFSAMLEHDTQEQRNNRLNIEDTTPEVIKEMLRFIYTDNVIDIDTVAYDLLAVADKYALHGLKVVCENALCGSLTAENATNILILADLHNADQLKDTAIDFINMHTIEVMDSDGFKSMAEFHPKLLIEILRSAATKKSAE